MRPPLLTSLSADHAGLNRRAFVLLWVRQHQQCLIVLAVCLITLGVLWTDSVRRAEARLEEQLDDAAGKIVETIRNGFHEHERLLHISKALFDASDEVTRDDWRVYVEQMDLEKHSPGVLGLGYVARVEESELADFVRAARADGAPDFRIKPHRHSDTGPHGPVSYVILYSEPAATNRAAWGTDVATNTLNKETYDASLESGRARVATGFPLAQAGKDTKGMVMTLPVHHRDGEHAGRVRGWVTTAVVLEAFLESIRQPDWAGFVVGLETPGPGGPRRIVATTPGTHGTDPALVGAHPEIVRPLDLFGEPVSVRLTPASPELVHADMRNARTLLLVGSMASALLTIITWTATRTRQHAVAMARQMTESLRLSEQRQRDLARRAEEANRAKSEFLANMSHEIRTPMTAILGYADIVESGDADGATRAEAVGAIRRAGRHLLTIINDVLDISKIESGRMAVVNEPCDLPAVISDAVTGLQAQAAVKGLDLRAELEGPIPSAVTTDGHRVRQILINLIGNAVKFTDSGTVRVRVSHAEDAMTIRVEDTGPGIHRSKLEAIFQPFEQADNSSSRRHEGTGLGLTISRRLANLLGGELTAASTVGVGSVFTLGLPAPVCEVAEPVSSLSQPTTAGARNIPSSGQAPNARLRGRVLLAEDGPDNQHLISFILRRAGLEVEVVNNGREAVERFAAGRTYDLFITDMQMPEMDGYVATRLLREDGHTLPILALTAHAMEGDRDRCLQAGCDDYEPKPIDRDSLLTKIRLLIAKDGPRASAA